MNRLNHAFIELLTNRDAKISKQDVMEEKGSKTRKGKNDESLGQRRFALEILPPEIWDRIFQHVESSEDLARCCKVSQSWKDILEPRKAEWKMDKVFLLLVNHLEKKEILSYRLVCGRWRRAIDLYLADGQFDKYEERMFHNRVLIGYQFPRNFFQTDFGPWRGSDEPVVKFMQKMAKHSHNPFIGRSLRVCVRHSSETFLEFLRKFGHFLESLEIYFEFGDREADPTTHTLARVKYICACLEQVQNLKRLSLFYSIYIRQLGTIGVGPGDSPYYGADEEEVKKYFCTRAVPIPPGIQEIGFVMDRFFDGGAFEAAFNRAKPVSEIFYMRPRACHLHCLQFDANENWYLQQFVVPAYLCRK